MADYRTDDGGERVGGAGRRGRGERMYEYGPGIPRVGKPDRLHTVRQELRGQCPGNGTGAAWKLRGVR